MRRVSRLSVSAIIARATTLHARSQSRTTRTMDSFPSSPLLCATRSVMSSAAPSSSASTTSSSSSTLQQLIELMSRAEYNRVSEVLEQRLLNPQSSASSPSSSLLMSSSPPAAHVSLIEQLQQSSTHSASHPTNNVLLQFAGSAVDARDVVLLGLRCYTALGRIDKCRELFAVALRDLRDPFGLLALSKRHSSSLSSGSEAAGKEHDGKRGEEVVVGGGSGSPSSSSSLSAAEAQLRSLQESALQADWMEGLEEEDEQGEEGKKFAKKDPLTKGKKEIDQDKLDANNSNHTTQSSRRRHPPITLPRFTLLNTALFDAYLEVLVKRSVFGQQEVMELLTLMRELHIPKSSLTYLYLIELHLRMNVDPSALWKELESLEEDEQRSLREMMEAFVNEKEDSSSSSSVVRSAAAVAAFGYATSPQCRITPAMAKALLFRYLPSATDSPLVVRIVRKLLQLDCLEPAALAQLTLQWIQDSVHYSPEHCVWLLFELEQRCVLERLPLVQWVSRAQLMPLLLQCAKTGDATSCEQVLALLDRHVMAKTAEIYALAAWCYATSYEIEKALDVVELMGRRGFLELTDPFKKYTLETLSLTMDRHFLMMIVDSIFNVGVLNRGIEHLQLRKQSGRAVSVHSLDLLLLACGKLHEEQRALQLFREYPTYGPQVVPRTLSYNALVLSLSTSSTGRGTSQIQVPLVSALTGQPMTASSPSATTIASSSDAEQNAATNEEDRGAVTAAAAAASVGVSANQTSAAVLDAMAKSGVRPNAHTFRLLIRHAILCDDIDAAVHFLEQVSTFPGLRVEVEMILPILERAARAGDADTVNRMSKYSLDCDVGIGAVVMNNVVTWLKEHGKDTSLVESHLPMHEALRSRSKVARRRTKHDVGL